ncbi:MAG: lamin tail domain-containing protein [Candidatus Neomarinimicrobiota bacterium]
MIIKKYLIKLVLASFIFSANADHLIFNRICITPDEAEMIEIYNPLGESVDLSNYYLSDSDKYYTWINGESIGNFDFLIKFPEGSSIPSGGSYTITTQSNLDFSDYYDNLPDISLVDSELDIFEFGLNPNLSGSEEMLVLFYWDGVSSIVQDVDYFLWGDFDKGVSKTIEEGYPFNDTFLENQMFIRNYSTSDFYDSLYVRSDINEYDEVQFDGNGITGHDETSENFNSSWNIEGIEKVISFQDIIDGEYDCAGNSQDGCPLGNLDCPIVNPSGMIVDYFDITQFGGPHALTIEDADGYRLELTIWPDNWDIANDPDYSKLLEAPFNRFLVQGLGNVFEYNGEKQILVCDVDDFTILQSFDMEGDFDGSQSFNEAIINPSPFVLVPSAYEVLDYSYSFPSNSRVIIRVFDISGRFITTLVDKYYESSGTVTRQESSSAWDGTNQMGQVQPPGTYLMHMEASNFQTGKTFIDIAPVVIGVKK